ncbi:MAG: TetR/AcrR family transcriptional regulator [Nitrospirae bacterium]|nr:TetR/AcrR family transcriptional regulator [Nitrospirota bacterium]
MRLPKNVDGKKDTKEAILDAAQSIIQSCGANGISYQHISDIVNIRKASIHYHFPTKDRLIEALVRRYSPKFLKCVDDLILLPVSARIKLKKYIELFEKTLQDEPGMKVCLCGMLSAELASMGNPTVLLLRRFYRENIGRLSQILDEGNSSGSLSFTGDSAILGALILSLLEGAMIVSRTEGGVPQFKAVKNQLLRLLDKK